MRATGFTGFLAAILAGTVVAASCSPAGAQTAPGPEAAITAALTDWAAAFNARKTTKICDLFAEDLRYDFRGFPERGYRDICDLLHASLADRSKRYSYRLDIREIIASGDLAVVRLVWTLDVAGEGSASITTSVEPGLDVFRRQPDGTWKIIRYISYEE